MSMDETYFTEEVRRLYNEKFEKRWNLPLDLLLANNENTLRLTERNLIFADEKFSFSKGVLDAYSRIKVRGQVEVDAEREFNEGRNWFLGEPIFFRPVKILRGFLVPAAYIPTAFPVDLHLFAFLQIAGEKDVLIRDTRGNFGIHYHYALASGDRTTTLICWDTRWVSGNKNDLKGIHERPIFYEAHGKGSYHHYARPDSWGDEKCQSIRSACVPDLKKFRIEDFRCASNKASPVWPKNVQLTPRP